MSDYECIRFSLHINHPPGHFHLFDTRLLFACTRLLLVSIQYLFLYIALNLIYVPVIIFVQFQDYLTTL